MSEIELKRERAEYRRSQRSLKDANYRLTDEIMKRCNVCDCGGIVLMDGVRLCKQHEAFVTCGGTCDLHNLIDDDEMKRRFGG